MRFLARGLLSVMTVFLAGILGFFGMILMAIVGLVMIILGGILALSFGFALFSLVSWILLHSHNAMLFFFASLGCAAVSSAALTTLWWFASAPFVDQPPQDAPFLVAGDRPIHLELRGKH
jgi:hypothetical protein